MWFLPDVTKKPIPDIIYKAEEKYKEYVKLADKLIEQHPIFARIVANRFDKHSWMPIKQQPIVPKETSYANKVVWVDSPLVIPTDVYIMCGI
jgi:acyl-CoA thioesterase